MTSVDICVATYKRPVWLGQLLNDLAGQEMPDGDTLRIIVVDNDPECGAAHVAQAFESTRVELLYLAQPVKNIALTRNMALDHCSADWLAFVDDDERVPQNWICTLLACQERFDADVVFGPVEGRLEANAPAWVRQSRFFVASPTATGTPQRWGATNNTLLRWKFVDGGARFDARFGLSGGEDTHFFYGLSRRGAHMVWCQEAVVTEHVPPDRTTLRWMLRRYFRGGQTFADIVNRPAQPLGRSWWVLRRSAMLVLGAMLAVLAIPVDRGLAVRLAGKAASYAGELSTLFRFRLQVYQ